MVSDGLESWLERPLEITVQDDNGILHIPECNHANCICYVRFRPILASQGQLRTLG
jgi:hypothetical protein